MVSDLDDTIKITETNDWARMVYNGFFTKKVFVGMPDLYRSMQDQYVDQTTIVTASGYIVEDQVKELLSENDVHYDELFLKKHFLFRSTYKYKFNTIEGLIENSGDDTFILIGDDSGEDHEVYEALRDKYPEKILRIYIRPIRGRSLSKNIHQYYSSFDIALEEYRLGRLDFDTLERIAYQVATHPENDEIISSSSVCPLFTGRQTGAVGDLIYLVQKRITKLCVKRASEIK
jgi:phosphatidate phosphatase APP1